MPEIDRTDIEGPKIDRRTTMKLLGAAGMAGLAGCTGTDEGESQGTEDQSDAQDDSESRDSQDGASQGSSITAGWLIDNIEFLDPHQVDLANQIEIHSNLFNGLVKLNQDVEIVGDAAADWSLPDDTTYVFELEDGITFQNGDPLDAEAVKWSLERLQEFEESPHTGKVEAVEEIEADGLELTVHLSRPVAPFISFMLRGPGRAGTIVHRSAEENPDEYNRFPVGSGPFQVTDREPGESLTLERHDDYWETDDNGNQLPYLDTIEIDLIPEPSTMWSALQGNAIDYANTLTGQFAQQAEPQNNFEVTATSSGEWASIAPLCSNPQENLEDVKWISGYDEITDQWNDRDLPTSDPRVRKALSMGINREELVEKAWFGYAKPAHTLYNPAIGWLYDALGGEEPETGQYYDPERAQELLDEAGYTGDPRIEMSVLCLPEDERELTVIQQNWQEIGVQIELDIQQQASYWDNTYRYEHMAIAYGGGADVDPWMSDFKQLGSPNPDTSEGAWQRSLYFNDEYSELLNEATRTPDLDARADVLSQANEVFVRDAPMLMTTFPLTPKVSTASLQGVGNQAGLSNFHYAQLND